MDIFQLIALLLTLSALASYINHRYFKLPATIGMMVIALSGSLVLVLLRHLGMLDADEAAAFIHSFEFGDLLLHGMLGFMLFAGALHINLDELIQVKWPVVTLTSVGTIIATAITGLLFWVVNHWFGFDFSLIYALIFGALIAPTDPIAVMGILKQTGANNRLKMKIAGESLFNDGIAIVIFLTLLGIITGETVPSADHIAIFLLLEVGGGALLGLCLGWISYQLIRSVDAYQVEILITLALVAGTYSLSEIVHVSAPIAVVTAGLLIGNHGRSFGMSKKTRQQLDDFWGLVDEFLNAILFVLIGLEVVTLNTELSHLGLGLGAIVIVLTARFISVYIPIKLLSLRQEFATGTIRILTWAGLRGGISIALALSLPESAERELIVGSTYIVVVFSILVQGLTIGPLIKRLTATSAQ